MSKWRQQTPKPRSWDLEQIKEWAARFGNDVLLGPRKVKIVRVITEVRALPEAGPGRWQASYTDEIIEEEVDLARSHNLTAEMFRALSLASYEAIADYAKRLREAGPGWVE